MDSQSIGLEIVLIAMAWVFVVVLVSRLTIHSKRRALGIGLPMGFLFAMTFFFIGALTYAVPGYSHLVTGNLYLEHRGFTERTVLLGSFAALIGVIGFGVGCYLSDKFSVRAVRPHLGLKFVRPKYQSILFIILGLFVVISFVFNSMPTIFPMQQVISQVGRNVAIPLVAMGMFLSLNQMTKLTYKQWWLLALSIPIIYLVVWGFVSYGFIVFAILAGYWFAVLPKRKVGLLKFIILFVLVTYILLSIFVVYMSFREDIRSVVWGGGSFFSRAQVIFEAFSNVKLLSPFDFESLDWLNIRLNQYIFVGRAIEVHEENPDLRLNGASLLLSLLGWIPRFIWTSKPEMGSNDLIESHTGWVFAEGATFGTGPVFEFYINFGFFGVFVGFVALGLILRQLDKNAAQALKEGRLLDFIRAFAVGIAFIAPLTELFFIVSTVVSSWLVLYGFKPLMRSLAGKSYK